MLIRGDARRLPFRDACVDCIVTSPPYYGLRDYGDPCVYPLYTSRERHGHHACMGHSCVRSTTSIDCEGVWTMVKLHGEIRGNYLCAQCGDHRGTPVKGGYILAEEGDEQNDEFVCYDCAPAVLAGQEPLRHIIISPGIASPTVH